MKQISKLLFFILHSFINAPLTKLHKHYKVKLLINRFAFLIYYWSNELNRELVTFKHVLENQDEHQNHFGEEFKPLILLAISFDVYNNKENHLFSFQIARITIPYNARHNAQLYYRKDFLSFILFKNISTYDWNVYSSTFLENICSHHHF